MKKSMVLVYFLLSAVLIAGSLFLSNLYLRHSIASWPINRMSFFHPAHFPLFQNFSVDEAHSKGWNLLLGDSFVAGLSDSLMDDLRNGRDHRFPSEDFSLLVQKPVLSIFSPGTGPVQSFLLKPREILRYLRRSHLQGLKDPERIYMVFFEGNDLDNDLKDFIIPFLKFYPDSSLDKDEVLEEFGAQLLKKNYREPRKVWDSWLSLDLIKGMARSLVTSQKMSSVRENKHWLNGSKTKDGLLIPSNLQGPSPETTLGQREKVLKVLGFIFRRLKAEFPQSNLCLVYLPSPIVSYQLDDHSSYYVRSYWGGKNNFAAKDLRAAHLSLKQDIDRLAVAQNVKFMDLTSSLENPRGVPLHGPEDWLHFNPEGKRRWLEAMARSW